jgi:hypothetical protein
VSNRTEVYSDPVTRFDMQRFLAREPHKPKILMVKDLRPDLEEGRRPIVAYLAFLAIALGLAAGLVLSLVRAG